MKTKARFLSALLALAMLISLAACGKTQSVEPEVQPTQAPKISAPEAYAALAEATGAVDAYIITVQYTLARDVGGTVFTETENSTLRVKDAGQKEMLSVYDCDRSVTVHDATTDCSFVRRFTGGRAYYDGKDGAKFYQQISAEDYAAMLLPKVLFTQDNFASVAYASDGSTIELTGGKDFEPWMDGQNAALSSLDGKVTASADGTIDTASLTAEYTRGGTAYSLTYSMRFAPDPGELSVSADKSEYCQTDDIRAPEYLAYARCAFDSQLLSASILTNASNEFDLLSVIENSDAQLYRTDDTVEAELTYSKVIYTKNDTDIDYTVSEYHDGVLSVTENENAPAEKACDGTEFAETLRRLADGLMPETGEIARFYLTDAEDCWIIDYDGTEALEAEKKELVRSLCTDSEDNVFEKADSYSSKLISGYVTLDKDTLLPVAAAQAYTGICTINGHKYYLTSSDEVSYSFENEEIYTLLTGELLPESEPEDKATPLLYEVTAPDGSKMWLMGTIHVGDTRTGFLPQEIYDVLYSSDALAVECDTDAYYEKLENNSRMQREYADAMFYSDGSLYYDHISDMSVSQVTQYVLEKYGLDMLFSLQPYKISSVASRIEGIYLALGRSLSSDKGVDERLLRLARDKDMQILEVESAEFQLKLLGGFPDTVQTCQLAGTVGIDRYEYNDNTREMYELWCSGDEAALREYLAGEEKEEVEEMSERVRHAYERYMTAYEQYNEEMVVKRNANMLKVAKQYMSSGKTVFFAVGLAHLLDEGGLVDALRDAGYTVEPVVYA